MKKRTPRLTGGPRLSSRGWFVVAVLTYLVLTVGMFADALFAADDTVLSSPGTDLYNQFIHWRGFGFEQLRNGNLPLWNPHVYCGAPFFGGFQSALLYPPNFLYLVFPLAKAINFGIALHVFLGGLFMYLWTRNRGLVPLACLMSGALFMFCGAHFLHIYAGHLPNLCTMIWAPLLLLAVDRVFERPSLGGWALGVFAVTMMCLSGHPQYVFFAAVAVVIYSAIRIVGAQRRKRVAGVLVGMVVGAGVLSAWQLVGGFQATRETLRSIPLPYEFASEGAFPPRNLITLLSPKFFGDMTDVRYWSSSYLWEMCLFVGVTGLGLAIYGQVRGEKKFRRYSVWMVGVLLLLAIGKSTPLHQLLYHVVPGFDKFRGISKFIYLVSIFLIMLSAVGADALIRNARVGKWTIVVLAVGGVLAAGSGLVIRSAVSGPSPADWWARYIESTVVSSETFLQPTVYKDPDFIRRAGLRASDGMLISAGTMLLLGLLAFGMRFKRYLVYPVVLLAVVEVVVFARGFNRSFPLRLARPRQLAEFFRSHPGDYRVVNNTRRPNLAMSMGAYDIWGGDPSVSMRYAQLIAFMQGKDPDRVDQHIRFKKLHPLHRMLRLQYVIVPTRSGLRMQQLPPAMGRLHLIGRYEVIGDRDAIFSALTEAGFDPARKVILESPPDPVPMDSPGARGKVRLVDSSTDHLTIEADLSAPSILLITDVYSESWKAAPLPGSAQQEYRVMPANYALQAIPLSGGHHLFRVEYRPGGLAAGKWVSIASAIAYAGLLGWMWWRKRREGQVQRKAEKNS